MTKDTCDLMLQNLIVLKVYLFYSCFVPCFHSGIAQWVLDAGTRPVTMILS